MDFSQCAGVRTAAALDGARPLLPSPNHSLTHSPTLAERERGAFRRVAGPTPRLWLHGRCTAYSANLAAGGGRATGALPPARLRLAQSPFSLLGQLCRTTDARWVLFDNDKVVRADEESVGALWPLVYLYVTERVPHAAVV